MTRIALYCETPVLTKGLESVLRNLAGFELLPPAGTVGCLVEQIVREAPDVALIDLTAQVTFAVLSDLRRKSAAKIILWVNTTSTEMAVQAMELGVRGILRKTLPADLQVKCIERVQAGEFWFEKTLTDCAPCARRKPLTAREAQLVTLLAQGLKNKEIAAALYISDGTVKEHLSRLFQKLGVKDRFELALFGLKNLNSLQLGQDIEGAPPIPGPVPPFRSVVLERMEDSGPAPLPMVPTLR